MKNNLKKSEPKTEIIIGPQKNTITLWFSTSPTVGSYEFLIDYIDLRLGLLKKEEMTAEIKPDEVPDRWEAVTCKKCLARKPDEETKA